MSITVRPASLAHEEDLIVAVLDRNLPDRPNRKIQRMRHANPLGPGWSWILSERDKDRVAGVASVFPRSFWVNGKKVLCGQVIEFAVEAPYRSLGPAVLLQKATFEPVSSGAVSFGYDCPPHERGMSTFLRLGMGSRAEVVRYALLLRSEEYLHKRLGSGIWTKPLVATANLVLRHNRSYPAADHFEVHEHRTAFGEEFSELDRVVSSRDMVRAGRAAEDLNWKYLEDPAMGDSSEPSSGRYQVLVVRGSGELIAFAVLFAENGFAWLGDLFGRDLNECGSALLEAAVDICHRQKIVRLDALCSSVSSLRPLLERVGFRPRERVYRVVPYENTSQTPKLLNSDLEWAFTNFEVS